MKEGKTTLAEIKDRYPFGNMDLADLAEVNPIVIDWMLEGKPVAKWQAVEVLKTLSMVTKEDYRLDTVEVVLAET
jgi:hypothetical protein